MSFRAPARADHEKFCQVEGWEQVRNARGKTGTHHITYELALPDGRILRTRISHPPDRTTYGASMWAHILRDQLDVTVDEFWACVRDGARPEREQPRQEGEGVPAELVYQLVAKWHVREAEVAKMTKQEAVERLQSLWAEQDPPAMR